MTIVHSDVNIQQRVESLLSHYKSLNHYENHHSNPIGTADNFTVESTANNHC